MRIGVQLKILKILYTQRTKILNENLIKNI